MNQVRSVLAVVAAALVLAACEGTGSITDPAFRNSKAAPNAQSGSGFHRDNGGTVGSGNDLTACENTGTLGSGYETGSCLHPDNTGAGGSGYNVAVCENGGSFASSPSCVGTGLSMSPSTSVKGMVRPTAIHRPGAGTASTPARPAADCTPTLFNTGAGGSGYNYCPPS